MTDAQNSELDGAKTEELSDAALKHKRKKALTVVGLILLIVAIAYAVWAIFFNQEATSKNLILVR